MIPETTRGAFGAFRVPGPTCPPGTVCVPRYLSAVQREGTRFRLRIGLHIRHSPRKVARSFPWPVFINLHKRCDSNDPTSAFARFIWTSHATCAGNHAGVRGLRDGGETNAQPHPPHDQPRPSYPTGTTASSPHPICPHSPISARNPRIRHAARPPPGTTASHPPHSCAQNADHLAQTPHIHPISPKWSALWAHPSPTPSDLPRFTNLHATHGYTTLPGPHQMPRPRIRTTHALKTQTTSPKTPHIHPISPKWSALWAHPSPTPSDLPRFTNLHATHEYTTLPGPHQAPRPRIRTTHALKTQTTSPKTPHIRSISPKWSALWAHTVQLEARRRRHNGCAYDLHHCGTRTLHHRCK